MTNLCWYLRLTPSLTAVDMTLFRAEMPYRSAGNRRTGSSTGLCSLWYLRACFTFQRKVATDGDACPFQGWTVTVVQHNAWWQTCPRREEWEAWTLETLEDLVEVFTISGLSKADSILANVSLSVVWSQHLSLLPPVQGSWETTYLCSSVSWAHQERMSSGLTLM